MHLRSALKVQSICCFLGCLAILTCLSVPAADNRHLAQAQNNQIKTVKSDLDSLVFEGHELHASLTTRRIEDSIRHLPAGLAPSQNPHVSTDAEFVNAIARSGSQGRLKDDGVRAVLYALYVGERELGFYGMEAASVADADRLELKLREIWAHNSRLDRARVHREGLVLVVVWTDGVSSECWESVNTKVVERLGALPPLRVEG